MAMNDVSEICSPQLVDRVIGETFDAELSREGFKKVGARKYVRSRISGVRDVVELRSTMVSLIVVWGFSFDFVPHIAGRHTETVRWHRTDKSANPDLRFSGLGKYCSGPREAGAEIPYWHGELRFREQADCSKRMLLPKALLELASIIHFYDFRRLFEVEAEDKFFFNLPQLSLAYCFYLAKLGDEMKARSYMSKWLQRAHYREETITRLTALLEQAIGSPVRTQ